MSEVVIPLPTTEEPAITQTVSLDGQSYVLGFDWNSRTDRWTFSMSSEDGTVIINGAALVLGIDLLRTVPGTFDYVPAGQLIAGGPDDPTLETIGAVRLFYIS